MSAAMNESAEMPDAPAWFPPVDLIWAEEWAAAWPGLDPWTVAVEGEGEAGELVCIGAPAAAANDPSYLVTALAGGAELVRTRTGTRVQLYSSLRAALLDVWRPCEATLAMLDRNAAERFAEGLAGL